MVNAKTLHVGTRVRGAGILVVALAVAALIAPRAAAQVTDVEPYWVEVTRDSVNIRSGDGEIWYAVGQVNQGTVLRVDGQGFEWLRVGYPRGLSVLLRADEAELTDRGTVRLTRATRLRNFNRDHGVVNSWKTLLDRAMPAGEELRHIETLRDEGGAITGFLVAAPESARAFVSERLVSRITEQEAMARLAPARPADAAARDAKTTPAPTPVAQGEAERPERVEPAPAPTEVVETAPEPAPEPEQEAPGRVTTRPVATSPAPEQAPVLTMRDERNDKAGERLLTLPELREAFDRVIAQPIHEAELQPLIDEHKALLDSLRQDPREENTRRFLLARIELLNIRADVQSNLDRLGEVESRAERGSSASEERLAEFMARPEYLLVGRLSTSAIYDGKRLPLLLRLTSVEDGAGRTLAYLAPDEALDLNAKLGAIVGVVGERRGQQGLRAAVINAARVDVLSP